MAKILKDSSPSSDSIDPSIALDVLADVIPSESDFFDFDGDSGDLSLDAEDVSSDLESEEGKESSSAGRDSDFDDSASSAASFDSGTFGSGSFSSDGGSSSDGGFSDAGEFTDTPSTESDAPSSTEGASAAAIEPRSSSDTVRDEGVSSESAETSVTEPVKFERDFKTSTSESSSSRESFKSVEIEAESSSVARALEAAEKHAAKIEEKASLRKAEKELDDSTEDKIKADKGADKTSTHKVTTPSEYKTGESDGEYIVSKHGDDMLNGHSGDDFIKSGKGEDVIEGNGGDDVLDGGHGNDRLDGGSGSDVLNADKGDDALIYTLGENTGATDYYDGGKGTDTLVLRMTSEEYALHEVELADLAEWIADNSDDRRSSSKQFNDASANSPAHPVYETSFGLHIRHMEELKIEITDVIEEPTEPTASEPTVDEPTGPSEITATVTGDGAVPLKNVDVSLTKGSQITLDIDVTVDELPAKYDVFMLHDLSGSFWDDLPNVQSQFSGLYDALSAKGDVAFGVGSFVDKPMETFGSSAYGDYVYNTDMAVSQDKAAIQETLDGLTTGWGYDWAESQMEALVQTALRGEEIGFREGAQKFAVLFTDATYHKEGDYSYAAEGANDYDTEFEAEDYPDPAVVGKMLVDAGITPIFAVTSYNMAMYQELVDAWGVGSVTLLSSDSSNIADAITSGITDAPINLELDALGDDYGFVSSIEPPIYEDVAPGTYTFSVTLEIPAESDGYSSDSMIFEVTGYGEVSVSVVIDSIDITGDITDDTLTGDAGPNGIFGMDGNDVLVGTGGEDKLFGGNGDDFLVGGLGNDEFTGGAGSDVFVFETGGGVDSVTDFSAGDLLDFRRVTTISTHAEVLAAATQVGVDTVLDLGDGDTVTLLGIQADDIQASDLLV